MQWNKFDLFKVGITVQTKCSKSIFEDAYQCDICVHLFFYV